LRNGKDFGLNQVSFAYQEGEGGIADALRLAEPFAAGRKNLCDPGVTTFWRTAYGGAREKIRPTAGGRADPTEGKCATPERFGVPVFEGKRIVRIEEKPKVPGSPYAVIGVYFYDGNGVRPACER